MIKNEIAQKYGQALFDLGKEKDNLVSLREELIQVWKIIKKNDELNHVLFHQRILPGDKKNILSKIFEGQVSGHLLNFLYLLVDKRREYFLETIVETFDRLVDREERIIKIEVVTAIELNNKLKKSLHKKLEQLLDYTLIINNAIDPSIIGGMIIKVGDYVIDGSIKNQLNSLEEKIEQIPVTELGV